MITNPDELLLVGRVGAAFGIRGQFKLQAITDQPEHLVQHIRTVYISSAYTPYRIVHAFAHKPGVIVLKLKGISTCEQVQTLRHAEVFIRESDSAPLGEDEYFIHQLYGLRVETTDGVDLGQVHDVLETGANDVLVVKGSSPRDVLIPMIRDVVVELDIAGGRVVIRLVDGLIEEQSETERKDAVQ